MTGPSFLALRDLSANRLRFLAHGIVFAIAVLAFILLDSYERSLSRDYRLWGSDQLIVQESNTLAEFYGSRISPDVGRILEEVGIADAVPEVHAIVGTSVQDAVLMKGVDLANYTRLDPFTMVAGRALQPGDAPRQAMIGSRLAARTGIVAGQEIRLRGRDFQVVGIFESGSYTENEAWVPLRGAQELLGWDQDVSLFVIPADGSLQAGQQLTEGIWIVRRGELWSEFPEQWSSLLTLIRTVTYAIGLSAALSLSVMLWRLSWQRRWQFAVLRSLGFSRMSFVYYLAVQGLIVAIAAGLSGLAGAVAVMRLAQVSLSGLSLQPQLEIGQLFTTTIWLALLTIASIATPAWRLGRLRVSELLVAY